MHDAGIARAAAGGETRLIGKTVEVVGLRKNGREFPLELSLGTWETGGARFFSGLIRDMSERQAAADKLRAVVESAPDPIIEVASDGTIAAVNARTDRLFGYEREQIIGRPVEELFAAATRSLIGARFAAVLQSKARDSQVALGHGPRAVGPAPRRHRVPGRRHGQPAADRRRHRADRDHPRHHGAQALRDPAPAPGRPRRADRPVQPSPLRPGAGRDRPLRRPLRRRRGAVPARPGPLQVRQRHARSQGRRRGHPRRRPRAARERPQDRRRGAARRRRVRGRPARRRPRDRRADRRGHARDRSRAPAAARGPADLDHDVDRHRPVRGRGAARRGPDGQRRSRHVRGQGGRREPVPGRRRRRGHRRHAAAADVGRPDPPRARRGPLRPLLPADHGARLRLRSRSTSCCCG